MLFRSLHRGEAAVDDHLLLHAVEVPDPQLAQDVGDEPVAGAVEGGVDHLEGFFKFSFFGMAPAVF